MTGQSPSPIWSWRLTTARKRNLPTLLAPPLPSAATGPADQLLDSAREHLLTRLRADADFWYELAKMQAVFGTREHDPAHRMTQTMINKLLADRREFPAESARATHLRPVMILIKGASVQRGTKQARIEAERRREARRTVLAVAEVVNGRADGTKGD